MSYEFDLTAEWAENCRYLVKRLKENCLGYESEAALASPLHKVAKRMNRLGKTEFAGALEAVSHACLRITAAHERMQEFIIEKVEAPLGIAIQEYEAIRRAEALAEEKRTYYDSRRRKAERKPSDKRRMSEERAEMEFRAALNATINLAQHEAEGTPERVRAPLASYMIAKLEYFRTAVSALEKAMADPAFKDLLKDSDELVVQAARAQAEKRMSTYARMRRELFAEPPTERVPASRTLGASENLLADLNTGEGMAAEGAEQSGALQQQPQQPQQPQVQPLPQQARPFVSGEQAGQAVERTPREEEFQSPEGREPVRLAPVEPGQERVDEPKPMPTEESLSVKVDDRTGAPRETRPVELLVSRGQGGQ